MDRYCEMGWALVSSFFLLRRFAEEPHVAIFLSNVFAETKIVFLIFKTEVSFFFSYGIIGRRHQYLMFLSHLLWC